MEHIGNYQGVICCRCSMNEYEEMYHRKDIDNDMIYIINGTMVHNGIIVGYYDGRHVVDDYNAKKFYVKEKKPVPMKPVGVRETARENEMKNEMKIPDIDFKMYSQIVDKFFEEVGL